MIRWIICIICVYGLFVPCFAQPKYNVKGQFKKQSAQGFAVYKSTAILLNHSGLCRVYDLKKKRVIGNYILGSKGKNNHANCASLGIEKHDGNKRPVLYVSECSVPGRCFVESWTDTSSVLLQTISLKKGGEKVVRNWIVDKKKKGLYAIDRREAKSNGDEWTCIHSITRYRLPKLSEGKSVVLSEKDVLDSFDILFPNMLQGGIIKGDYLYLPTGLCDTSEVRADKERSLIIVNLKSHKIEQKIDLTNLTKDEPEDCDFYKNKLLLFCGQSGGLYEIPLK